VQRMVFSHVLFVLFYKHCPGKEEMICNDL